MTLEVMSLPSSASCKALPGVANNSSPSFSGRALDPGGQSVGPNPSVSVFMLYFPDCFGCYAREGVDRWAGVWLDGLEVGEWMGW